MSKATLVKKITSREEPDIGWLIGSIIEWPLNGLFHDRRDVIITSQMIIIRFPSNDGRYLKFRNFVS